MENKVIDVCQNKWSIPLDHEILRESTFFIRGGVGRGFGGGGSSVNFLQIGEAQTCFIRNGGGGNSFFWQGKNLSMSLS